MNDLALRLAAISHCQGLRQAWPEGVPWNEIKKGFLFEGEQVFIGSTARGIHKPKQMQRGALSIKTVKPTHGREASYQDEILDDDYFRYAFFQNDPSHANNRWLKENHEDQSPLIYFWALVPGVYEILAPCFIHQWNSTACTVDVAVGMPSDLKISPRVAEQPELGRRYATIEAKQRIHQAEFRRQVLDAYDEKCAISGLPVVPLLEAAHIIPDSDERGVARVDNGICLSRLHHAAYDRNLLGIDPDGVVHIAPEVMNQQDGPVLVAGLQDYHGHRISLPRNAAWRPNRDGLAGRFEEFRSRW